ncbi:MAG: hypothetical protein ACREMY_08035, partial [bacterium]
MINPELEKYVRTSLANNLEPSNIKRVLVAADWDPNDVDAALAAVQNPQQPHGPAIAVNPVTVSAQPAGATKPVARPAA